MNSESLDEKENNYIGYILDLGYAYSIAYSDITTGELNAFIIEKDEEKLRNEIINICIIQVLLFIKIGNFNTVI